MWKLKDLNLHLDFNIHLLQIIIKFIHFILFNHSSVSLTFNIRGTSWFLIYQLQILGSIWIFHKTTFIAWIWQEMGMIHLCYFFSYLLFIFIHWSHFKVPFSSNMYFLQFDHSWTLISNYCYYYYYLLSNLININYMNCIVKMVETIPKTLWDKMIYYFVNQDN